MPTFGSALMNKLKQYFWIALGTITIGVCVFLYVSLSSSSTLLGSFFLLLAFAILLLSAYLFYKQRKGSQQLHSHTMVNSLERVFKVVTAEGQFTDIVDFEDKNVKLPLLRGTKKALVIVKAKVQMGYDFKKIEWEGDEVSKKLKLKSFPPPEILSISPEIKYYNLENGLFNKFKNEDLNAIQSQCIEHITQSALESNLPQLASQQAKFLLTEMAEVNKWELKGLESLKEESSTD
jgi:preprotein translocase subunit YajC